MPIRYVLPVKLSLRFVAMFPVKLPNLANESSAISAVRQLCSLYAQSPHLTEYHGMGASDSRETNLLQ